MADPITHPNPSPVRSHDYQTGRDGQERLIERERRLGTVLLPFEARGVFNAVGPVRRVLGSPGELPPAR